MVILYTMLYYPGDIPRWLLRKSNLVKTSGSSPTHFLRGHPKDIANILGGNAWRSDVWVKKKRSAWHNRDEPKRSTRSVFFGDWNRLEFS